MINKTGALCSRQKSPSIYFIVKERYLYIGETQKHPAARWGQHLRGGSFSNALQSQDPEVFSSPSIIWMSSFECTKIMLELSAGEQRRATQWVEHDLHVKACSHARVGSRLELVSDTKRTAPSYPLRPWLATMSDLIFDQFVSDLYMGKGQFFHPINPSQHLESTLNV